MKKIILVLLIFFLTLSCTMLDKIPPVLDVSLSKISEIAGENIILNVSATDQSGIDRIEIYANDNLILKTTQLGQISVPSPYGSFTVKVVVYDKAGNSTSKVIGSFKTRDLTKPQVSVDYTPKGVRPSETVTVIVSAQDNESGVRVTGLRINKKEVQLTNNRYTFQVQAGVYELEAYAIDNEGNDNTAKTTLNVSVTGDTSGPEILFPDLVKKAKPGTTVNITISATDESGVSKIIFNDGKETMYIPTMPATQLIWNLVRNVGTTNPYGFSVTAYDSRNNYTTKTGSIEIGTNLPPSVSIEVDKPAPKEGEKVRINVNASDDSMVKQVVLYIDNAPVRTFNQQPYTHEWTAVKGIHKIKAVATDDSNESTEAFYTINVGVIDTEAPVIYFTSPYGVVVNEAYTFYVFVTDNIQVSEVSFTFTGPTRKGPILASTIGGGVFTITETFTEKGNYEVIVVAKDSSGNSSSQKGQFPVDEAYIVKAPKIKEFSYSPSVLNQGERVNFKVVAQDDLSLSRCDFYVNGIKRDSIRPSVNNFEWQWIATTLGVHDIRVVVLDTEGFTAEATGTVTVVTSRPIAKILQPEDGYRTPFADNLSLSLNAQVVDTNNPSVAYFDVKGPVDERIPVTASGEGPVYTFTTKWKVQTYGEYQIDFYYKNDINLSDATSVSVNILDLGVVFEQPLPNQQHQCGYDLTVRAKVSIYLTESEKFEISYASRKLELSVPNPVVTTSTYNIYQTTIPSTFFTEPGSYTITFSGKTIAGEEGKGTTYVNVIDTESPAITQAKIDSSNIVENGIYNVPMSSNPTISVTATDNRQVKSIELQKKISGIYTNMYSTTTNSLNYVVQSLDSFENYFRIVVKDLENNQTVLNFVIYAYEQNSPNVDGFRAMQLYPSAPIYDMSAQLLVQIRGTLNNNTQFKVTDDTSIKEVRARVIDSQTNGSNYREIIKKLYEYTTGNLAKEIFINNQDIPMFTPTSVGSYKVVLEAVDVFDNTKLIAQQDLVVEDLTPPIVNVDIPQRYYGTNNEGKKIVRTFTDVKVSFLDNTEPIHKVELWIVDAAGATQKIGEKSDLATNSWTFENISLASYVDGVAKFKAKATTTSGATGEGEVSVVIDNKTSPVVTIQLPTALTFGSRQVYKGLIDVIAQITNTDVPYDVQKVELYIDGTKTIEITSPVIENGELKFKLSLNTISYSDGTHVIALKVYDHAKNSSELTDSRSFANVIFDNRAPVLLSDSGRIYTNQNTVTLQIDESYGVLETILKIANKSIDPIPNTFTFVHGLSQNTSDSFSLYMRDTAGNVANYSGTLYYDTVQPNITIQSVQPTNMASETGALFTLSFSDNLTSVSTLNVYENSSIKESLGLSWGQTSLTWTYNPPTNYEGQKTFGFEVYDRAGNLSNQVQYTIDIDTFAPRINSFNCDVPTLIGGIYYTNIGTSNVTWSVNDSYFDKVVLENNSTRLLDNGSYIGTHNVALNFGLNVIKLTAYDQIKHKTEQMIRIIYDNQEPQISNVRFANKDVTENATITITSTGDKSLELSVTEPYIYWSESSLYVNDNKVTSGNDWQISGTTPNYTVLTMINIAGNSKIEIILKDYAGNQRKFTFYVEVGQ